MSEATALTVYERIPDPVAAVKQFGNAIAKSGMFGCQSIEQGEVFALECLARRMPPLMLAETYHVIFGKLSMKAEAMLAKFEQAGGKYKIKSRTPELVSIEMVIGDSGKQIFSLSWEDAKKEPFPYDGKEAEIVKALTSGNASKLTLKPKYATPRSRTQMLWARLVSDSVRCLCPKVVSGTYTPEENEDIGEEAAARANGNGHAKPQATATTVVDQAAEAAKAKSGPAGEVIEADFEVVKDEPTKPALITTDQLSRLAFLTHSLQLGPQVEKACKKRGCNSTRSLSQEQAAEIIGNLEIVAAKKAAEQSQAVDQAAGKSSVPASAKQWANDGPCTEEQILTIKAGLREWGQIDKESANKFLAELQSKIRAAGNADGKLAGLTAKEAAEVGVLVSQKNLAAFIDLSLQLWRAKESATVGELVASGN